jgi:hypothetical protein
MRLCPHGTATIRCRNDSGLGAGGLRRDRGHAYLTAYHFPAQTKNDRLVMLGLPTEAASFALGLFFDGPGLRGYGGISEEVGAYSLAEGEQCLAYASWKRLKGNTPDQKRSPDKC